ncbi:hypothetical protein FIU86_01020 [Roseovarius sp. THAF9]|uniref:hypothetical protein n=1 Tax=Roseovarius sp. THAF9 TaxID=2587847 RepID=UPI0012695ADD|nr:hypothetical protein [Roseovarius sp. THAF9]QFT91408.1 hypothetical protein FIU86_01020 [Roseovarius sp. THAF9]
MSFETWAALTVLAAFAVCILAAKEKFARAGSGLAVAASAYSALQILEAVAPEQTGTAATIIAGATGAGLGLTIFLLAGGQI